MNKTFAEHVTNTAFFLSISKKQIAYLEVLYRTPHPHPDYYARSSILLPDNWVASYRALQSKGLVERIIDDPVSSVGHYALTNAGRITCELLVEAGLIPKREDVRVVA